VIWNYTLAGYVVDLERKQSMFDTSADRFCLLRVCRQTYAEAVSLPRKLITAKFRSFRKFAVATLSGRLNSMNNIRLSTLLSCLVDDFEGLVPRSVFEPFQSFDITVNADPEDSKATIARIEKDLKDHLHGKDVVIRCDTSEEWMLDQWP
jgi:hypothetical protein